MPELTTADLETTIDPDNDYFFMADVSETPDAINRVLMKYIRQTTLYIPVGDESTNLTTGDGKAYFRMPFAMTLISIRASVNTAPVGSTIIVDVTESGSTVFSTLLTIDDGEKTSSTAGTPAVLSDTSLADDAEIIINMDQIGSGTAGKGLKIWLIGYRS